MELILAHNNRAVFTSLFNIYVHELSEYNPWLAKQMNDEGNYLREEVNDFFTTKTYEPYLIYDENHPIGFVVFSKDENNWEEEVTCSIEELFIVKTSRKKGYATKIAKDFWEKEKGSVSIIGILKENHTAIRFWENLIKQYDTDYVRSDEGTIYVYKFKI